MNGDYIKKLDQNESNSEKMAIEYLLALGFSVDRNVLISVGTRRLEADAVAYLDSERKRPYIVAEVKRGLSTQPTILDAPVQQAFAMATGLGDQVRFLLITDGRQHHWFERNPERQSLEAISTAPVFQDISLESTEVSTGLRRIQGSDQYAQLLEIIIDKLRNEGLSFGLRMGIEINRILIAKLQDESVVRRGGESRLSVPTGNPERTAKDVRDLYNEAVEDLGGTPIVEGIWLLSPKALDSVLDVLRLHSISSVSRASLDRTFWMLFPNLLRSADWRHLTPAPLAEFLVGLIDPAPGESVIDPVCGSGLLLLEALRYVESNFPSDNPNSIDGQPSKPLSVIGVEVNAEVAELAATNFVLSRIPPKQIHNTNALIPGGLEAEGIGPNAFDVVVMNPPIGEIPKQDPLSQSGLVHDRRLSFELLCIVRGLELLRMGGRLASFVPESFLSSPRYERGRAWLLEHATLRAIISLPPEAFMPVGHAGKASLLIIDNKSTEADDEVLVVDVQNVGYDRFGHSTRGNQLPEVTKLMSRFNKGLPLGIQDIFASSGIKRLRAWTVSPNDLDPSGLGLAKLDPRSHDVLHSLLRGRYPVAKLDQIVEVIGGRNFKSYVDDPAGAALLIQAGNVRESELQLANAPYISMDDYWSAPRAQVKIGDVLITTTGAYLGRTALVGSLPRSSSASGAVTILRPNSDIDPSYLEAILNSEIGSEQITKLRAASSAQPFIRRKDLGELLIPLPPLAHQRALANRITEMLDEARRLAEKARQLEEEARRMVVSEILGGGDNE